MRQQKKPAKRLSLGHVYVTFVSSLVLFLDRIFLLEIWAYFSLTGSTGKIFFPPTLTFFQVLFQNCCQNIFLPCKMLQKTWLSSTPPPRRSNQQKNLVFEFLKCCLALKTKNYLKAFF